MSNMFSAPTFQRALLSGIGKKVIERSTLATSDCRRRIEMSAELPVTDDDMIAGVRAEYERLSSTAEGPHACFRYNNMA